MFTQQLSRLNFFTVLYYFTYFVFTFLWSLFIFIYLNIFKGWGREPVMDKRTQKSKEPQHKMTFVSLE